MNKFTRRIAKLTAMSVFLWNFTMVSSFADGVPDDYENDYDIVETDTAGVDNDKTCTVESKKYEVNISMLSQHSPVVRHVSPYETAIYRPRLCPAVDLLGVTLRKPDLGYLGKAAVTHVNCTQGYISKSQVRNASGLAFHDDPRDSVPVMNCDVVLKHALYDLYTVLRLKYDHCEIGAMPRLHVTQVHTDPMLDVVVQQRLIRNESDLRLLLDVGLVYTGEVETFETHEREHKAGCDYE